MRSTYVVSWSIEVDAESPEEAAQLALEVQRDPSSDATVFSVAIDEDTTAVIDLDRYEI